MDDDEIKPSQKFRELKRFKESRLLDDYERNFLDKLFQAKKNFYELNEYQKTVVIRLYDFLMSGRA